MAYVRQIAREAVAQLGLDRGYELGTQFVSQSYQELCAKAQFRHLRRLGQLFLPAPVSDGNFTVTLNSQVVTADSGATAALQAVSGAPFIFSGWWFRIQQGSVWYRIQRVDPSNSNAWNLILETPYASDNNAMGVFASGNISQPVGYYVIPRFVALEAEARTIGTVVCDAVYRPLTQLSEDELNLKFSSRQLISFPPRWFAIMSSDENTDGIPKTIDIYPWPANSTTLHYTYWKHPPELSIDAQIPPTIDPDILREGAIRGLMRNQMGKAIRDGNLEAAAFWRNEFRTQQTTWDRLVSRAVRNDRGGDDLKFLLKRSAWMRPAAPRDWDPVNDAFTNFLSRGL